MFRLFKTKKVSTAADTVTDKAAGKIHQWVYALQTRFAKAMSKQEHKMSITQKKWALVFFCLFMSAVSGYWLYQGIATTPNSEPAFFKKNRIIGPANITLPDSLDIHLLEEYQRREEQQRNETDSLTR